MKKSTKIAHIHHKMRTVSLFGSALFIAAITIQAVVAGTVLWYLRVFETSVAINAAGAFGLLALAGILPPLIAFFIGDRSTKVRSKYEHFYNGMLFAFMTIWLGMFITFYIAPSLSGIKIPFLTNEFGGIWPAMFALAIAIAIGIEYGQKRHQKLLHEFLPFKLALTIPLIALIAGSAWELIRQLASPNPSVYGLMIIMPVILMVGLLVISYTLSTERTPGDKLTEACVSASIGLFAIMIASQLRYAGFGIATDILVPSAIGILVWLAFLYFYFYRRTDKLS